MADAPLPIATQPLWEEAGEPPREGAVTRPWYQFFDQVRLQGGAAATGGFLNFGAAETVNLSSTNNGTITISGGNVLVDPNGNSTLNNIVAASGTTFNDGDLLILRATNLTAGSTISLQGFGNINRSVQDQPDGDDWDLLYSRLPEPPASIMLIFDTSLGTGGEWEQISWLNRG